MFAQQRRDAAQDGRSEITLPSLSPRHEQLVESHPGAYEYVRLRREKREKEMPSTRRDFDHSAGTYELRPPAGDPDARHSML